MPRKPLRPTSVEVELPITKLSQSWNMRALSDAKRSVAGRDSHSLVVGSLQGSPSTLFEPMRCRPHTSQPTTTTGLLCCLQLADRLRVYCPAPTLIPHSNVVSLINPDQNAILGHFSSRSFFARTDLYRYCASLHSKPSSPIRCKPARGPANHQRLSDLLRDHEPLSWRTFGLLRKESCSSRGTICLRCSINRLCLLQNSRRDIVV